MKTITLQNGGETAVSDEDFDRLTRHRWSRTKIAHKTGWVGYYVCRIEGHNVRKVFMHREILGAGPRELVDHKDRNGLNNTRENLRLADRQRNMWNVGPMPRKASKYKGVCLKAATWKWQAYIRDLGKQRYIKQSDSEIVAALKYDEMASELFGEWAVLNFPWVRG